MTEVIPENELDLFIQEQLNEPIPCDYVNRWGTPWNICKDKPATWILHVEFCCPGEGLGKKRTKFMCDDCQKYALTGSVKCNHCGKYYFFRDAIISMERLNG